MKTGSEGSTQLCSNVGRHADRVWLSCSCAVNVLPGSDGKVGVVGSRWSELMVRWMSAALWPVVGDIPWVCVCVRCKMKSRKCVLNHAQSSSSLSAMCGGRSNELWAGHRCRADCTNTERVLLPTQRQLLQRWTIERKQIWPKAAAPRAISFQFMTSERVWMYEILKWIPKWIPKTAKHGLKH